LKMYVTSFYPLFLPMSSVLTLLFAPSFLLLIHYFDFKRIVLVYIVLSLVFLIYSLKQKKKIEDFVILAIYLILLTISYFYVSIETVKFIPVFTSIAFFTIFAESAIRKKELIYKLTQKFYKKDLSDAESKFLKKGDAYWAFSILLYAIVQVILVFSASDTIWAIYSSIGWYVYFVATLGAQIIYGKIYALKMSA
jgi:uncharacterized membrane protein